MTDEEKAHYEEWKKKCAETRAIKKQELAQAQAQLLREKPGYRIPTRGDKKGQLVWMGYRQQQTDINMVRNAEKHREAVARRAIEAANAPPASIATPTAIESSKRNEIKPYEVILAYLFACAVTLTYVFIAKAIAQFGFLGLAILIDFALYSIKAKKTYRSRYAPFLWWFLMQRK
jgi:hypothetical protein